MTEAATGLTWPVLKRGSKGQRVKTLQHLLRAAREHWRQVVNVDGIFGPKTESVVRAYQSGAGLPDDGIVGRNTWSSLTGNVVFGSTVRLGDSGEAVMGAENELDRHHISILIDGIFGPRTEAAVREFQQMVDLTVDGVVGPKTWQQFISRNP
jgi:murein L,D-transpeptidase YcbB/YkuD